jgi:hypothetical protein
MERGKKTMCDYSLHNIRNRLAVEGEPLQLHRFPTGSLGLASPSDLGSNGGTSQSVNGWQRIKNLFKTSPPVPAVCVPCGTHLILREIPLFLQKRFGITAEEEVIFTQLSLEPHRYRDGIRFHNGQEILLQYLPIGLQLDVLCLSAIDGELVRLSAENLDAVWNGSR